MTRQEFLQGMIILSDVYGKNLDERAVSTWYLFFKDDDFSIFKQAVSRVVVKSRFFPSVADIKDEMRFINVPIMTAEDEWTKVVKAIQRYGFYNAEEAMKSLDPLTQKSVMNIGGFQRLCMSEEGDWDRKNFIKAFNDLKMVNSNLMLLQPIKDETRRLDGDGNED